ncbi:MAG: hypothetical protein FWH01_11140 [Oscillospiraceae bacterium]|nr:hypothetical protein [Oscillospiraceae bacterium]
MFIFMTKEKFRGAAVRLACIFVALAVLLLLAPSCSVGGGGRETTAPEGGGDGDGLGDGSGGGGNDSNGDGYEDDGEGDGGDEFDDAFATSPAVIYPQEVQAQLETFHDIASQLSLDDVASAAALLMAYRDLVIEGPVNDALFFAYEEYMQFVCEGLNSEYEEEPPDDGTINNALENGFLYIEDNDYSAYFILRPDFLKDTFAETVSARVQAFLNLLSKHYNFRSGYDFIEGERLMVTLDQLAEMIVDWENYIRVYPDVTNRSDIEMNLDYYLKIYIGSIQIDRSGLYVLACTDENGEALYKLMDEPRQSYIKFVENYQDSAACPLIAELYHIYSENNFLYSIEVEEFFKKHSLAYDIV